MGESQSYQYVTNPEFVEKYRIAGTFGGELNLAVWVIAILGSTAKFNSRQFFRLYGNIIFCDIAPSSAI